MKKSDSIEHWQAARNLFEQYIDQPATQALKQIQSNDAIPKAIKSKLIKLIKSQTQKDTIVDNPDLSFFSSLNNLTEDLSGKSVGDYRLMSRIGTGGMSHVYKAKRKGADIQKYVALKLINVIDSESSANLKTLFEREQLTLSRLNHPNIISLHHGGISKSGIPFLVMDYIEAAADINDYVTKNKLPTNKIVRLIQLVADAITFAHQKFIVHKDIKPNNIIIDKHGIPKVVDFGIATMLKEDNNDNQQQIFTPDYASPEQIQGKYVSPNSDVFSLCAVLLLLLTKQKPLPFFEVNNYQPMADTQHINKVLYQSQLENDLINIIKKGLEINPDDRYQSMQDFNNDLESWLNLKPVLATKSSKLYIAKKFIQRHKATVTVATALLFSVILGITLIVQQKNQAQLEALKAQQITSFLIESIQASDPDLTKGKEVSVKELLHNAKRTIQENAFDDIHLTAILEQTIGSALAKVGEYQEAEKLLMKAIQNNHNNFKARINLAQIFLQQQLFSKANEQLLYLTSKNSSLTFNDNIQVLQIDAEILHKQGKFSLALNKIEQAITMLEKKPSEIKQLIASQLILAQILSTSGDIDESISLTRKTLAISQNNFGDASSMSTNISMLLANILTSSTPFPIEEILQIYQQTIHNQTIIYGKQHPIIAKTYLQYGFALKSFGKLQKAHVNAQKAREIALVNFGENHMLTAHIDLLISQLKVYQGDIDGAILQLQNVLTVYENHFGKTHYETNQTKTTLSVYLIKANKAQEALDMLLPLYQLQKQQLGEFNKATFYVQLNIIKSYNLLGNYQLAIAEGTRTLKLSQQHIGIENIISIGLEMTLAKSYLLANNPYETILLCQDLLNFDLVKNHPEFNKRVIELLAQAQNPNLIN